MQTAKPCHAPMGCRTACSACPAYLLICPHGSITLASCHRYCSSGYARPCHARIRWIDDIPGLLSLSFLSLAPCTGSDVGALMCAKQAYVVG